MRPRTLIKTLCAGFGLGVLGFAQSVAFTFDDGPRLAPTPRLSAPERNGALLAALDKHQVKAALFVTLNNGANQAEGLALARAWGEAGHALGNHTVTHLDLNAKATTLKQYEAEVLACDQVIRSLPGFKPWFRFTFLREGDTPEKRDGMKAFLKAHGFLNAYVSLDTSDWRLDAALVAVLTKHPDADRSITARRPAGSPSKRFTNPSTSNWGRESCWMTSAASFAPGASASRAISPGMTRWGL